MSTNATATDQHATIQITAGYAVQAAEQLQELLQHALDVEVTGTLRALSRLVAPIAQETDEERVKIIRDLDPENNNCGPDTPHHAAFIERYRPFYDAKHEIELPGDRVSLEDLEAELMRASRDRKDRGLDPIRVTGQAIDTLAPLLLAPVDEAEQEETDAPEAEHAPESEQHAA